ncbi:MAG: hypothetical protein F6J93_09945 [Oscillatoria sp. SIO1A7]|nr:hypothetical protein [Oscillatoria sp. SIO1A7]
MGTGGHGGTWEVLNFEFYYQDLRNDTIDWGGRGGIAPTNTRYGQVSVSPDYFKPAIAS